MFLYFKCINNLLPGKSIWVLIPVFIRDSFLHSAANYWRVLFVVPSVLLQKYHAGGPEGIFAWVQQHHSEPTLHRVARHAKEGKRNLQLCFAEIGLNVKIQDRIIFQVYSVYHLTDVVTRKNNLSTSFTMARSRFQVMLWLNLLCLVRKL